MADRSTIEWTDATWNPLRGCSRVSAGCQHCYAERVAARFSGPGMPYEGLIHPTTRGWNGQVRLVPEVLDQPLRWRRPRRIFVNSMSDVFHESVPDDRIDQVFGVMWACLYNRYEQAGHIFQVLTKRPARMLEYLRQDRRRQWAQAAANYGGGLDAAGIYDQTFYFEGPHPRIWLGVSVENQAAADERIPLLLEAPAAVRWLSCEPLLGPIDLRRHFFGHCPIHDFPGGFCLQRTHEGVQHLHWVVTGGESGARARPMHPDWARSLRDQCAAAGVPFFFKQWGEWIGGAFDARKGKMICQPTLAGEETGRIFWASPGQPKVHRFEAADHYWTHAAARIGKRAAGRLLDGREHNEWPRTANSKEI